MMSHALFDNVYVEKRAASDSETKRILERIGCKEPAFIDHYKDVFDREDSGKGLILAHNPGKHLYEGAPVCQSFGNEHFYYSPGVMNCLYDCEYCFLKGMYPGRNICIFTDLEETFAELAELEKKHPVYVCASYNTDLTALESITGFIARWCERVLTHENLSVEIRSKCGRTDIYASLPVSDRCIFAFTLSPDEIIDKFEKGTPKLSERLAGLKTAMETGFPVRICFDPMIYTRDWQDKYSRMMEKIVSGIDITKVMDISVGTFRISGQYLGPMRKREPEAETVQYPYVLQDGYYAYPDKVRIRMEEFMTELIEKNAPGVPVFNWR